MRAQTELPVPVYLMPNHKKNLSFALGWLQEFC